MKDIFSISAGSNVAKAKATNEGIKGLESSKQNDQAKDFFSVMFSQIKEGLTAKEKNSENIKENALLNTDTKEITSSNEKKTLGEHLLKDILEVVSILKSSSEEKPSFPNYSDKLDKLLTKQSVLNDFKEVKNINDLFKLSKKYNLGLENITAKKIDMETLKSEFPKLDKSFFNLPELKETQKGLREENPSQKEVKNTKNEASEAILKSMEKPEKKTQKEPSLLEKIMQPKKEEKTETSSIQVKENTQTKEKSESLHVKEKVGIETTPQTKEKSETPTPTLAQNEKKIVKESSENVQKITPVVEEKKEEKKVLKETKKEDILPKETETTNVQNTRAQEVKVEGNTQKKGFVETILQGLKNDKPSQENSQKVMAQSQEIKTKESITTQESSSEIKSEPTTLRTTDLKNPLKTETLQSKQQTPTNQSLNSFANDLKERIENYKPPLMKVQMALNPKALGEVDVTIINRGNNLQVNITSNATTMSLFTQNQAEFKNSLVNMGFTNLEMNFSDQREQKNHENRQALNNIETNEELSEEELSEQTQSVELIVPQYV